MEYASRNILKDFEFHDALMTFKSYHHATLIVSARYLNIHKSAKQNMHENDMEIDLAKITFSGFCVKTFEPGRAWRYNEIGELYTDEPQVIFNGISAEEKFVSELRSGVNVFEFGLHENGNLYLDGAGIEPWFQVQFVFDSAIVEWDKYRNVAWYEERR